jgi:hypothetical protein
MTKQYNDVLTDLQDYMFDEVNMINSLRMKIEFVSKDITKNTTKDTINNMSKDKYINSSKQTLFIPNQPDSLFWCFYIIKNGDVKYEMLNNKNALLSKQMKIELVDLIRKNKDIVKQYKFDTISNHESNLATNNNLNVKSFLTLCAIENINIIYIKKNTYYELLMNNSNFIYCVNEIQTKSNYNNKYGYELISTDSLNNIRNTFFKLDSIDKTIKAISSYKLNELNEICIKLAIKINNDITGKQKSKKELYESIIQYF